MADKNFPGAKITKLRIDREKASRMCMALSLRFLISERTLQTARSAIAGETGCGGKRLVTPFMFSYRCAVPLA